MIDPETGTLSFDASAVRVGPGLTAGQFLSAPWGRAAAGPMADERPGKLGACKLEGRHVSASVPFVVVLYFERRRLARVELAHDDPSFGTSWDDCSEEKELHRKASHDRWLAAAVGDRRSFPWGRISSDYDRRGCASSITIHYGPGLENGARPARRPGRWRVALVGLLVAAILAALFLLLRG